MSFFVVLILRIADLAVSAGMAYLWLSDFLFAIRELSIKELSFFIALISTRAEWKLITEEIKSNESGK